MVISEELLVLYIGLSLVELFSFPIGVFVWLLTLNICKYNTQSFAMALFHDFDICSLCVILG